MDWFLYNNGVRLERVKYVRLPVWKISRKFFSGILSLFFYFALTRFLQVAFKKNLKSFENLSVLTL